MANNNFAQDIQLFLRDYVESIDEEIDEIAEKVAEETVQRLKADSPERTGKYAKSWKVKKVDGEWIVYNQKHYQLTHLLEKGHAKEDGTGRVSAKEHIKPVEEVMVKKYINKVTGAINK